MPHEVVNSSFQRASNKDWVDVGNTVVDLHWGSSWTSWSSWLWFLLPLWFCAPGYSQQSAAFSRLKWFNIPDLQFPSCEKMYDLSKN